LTEIEYYHPSKPVGEYKVGERYRFIVYHFGHPKPLERDEKGFVKEEYFVPPERFTIKEGVVKSIYKHYLEVTFDNNDTRTYAYAPELAKHFDSAMIYIRKFSDLGDVTVEEEQPSKDVTVNKHDDRGEITVDSGEKAKDRGNVTLDAGTPETDGHVTVDEEENDEGYLTIDED